jgi:hypothetical protein
MRGSSLVCASPRDDSDALSAQRRGASATTTSSRSGHELAYQLNATRSVQIEGLRLPFPSHWRSVRGTQRLTTSNDARLESASDVRVKAEQLFGLHMTPDSSGAVTVDLVIDVGLTLPRAEPDWTELARVFLKTRGFGPALARSMFQLPFYPWKLGETAAALGTQPRSLQMTLFREGYSFDAALRRCRRLHILLDGGHSVSGLKVMRKSQEPRLDFHRQHACAISTPVDQALPGALR